MENTTEGPLKRPSGTLPSFHSRLCSKSQETKYLRLGLATKKILPWTVMYQYWESQKNCFRLSSTSGKQLQECIADEEKMKHFEH